MRAMARSSSDNSGTCYVLWVFLDNIMFSRGPVACGIGNICVSAMLEQVVRNYQCIPQMRHNVSLSRCIQWQQIAHCGISDDYMRGAAIGWWPAACHIIKAKG